MKYYCIAGETSGDLHGGPLLREIKKRDSEAIFRGVGGLKMQAEGLQSSFPLSDFQVMGFTDVLFAFKRLWNRFHFILDEILFENPDAIIFIDYPGFNLRLAKKLRKKGYKGKLIYYISPTVWAWGKKRIQTMEENLDVLLTIYPFEPQFFNPEKLPVFFVGHPLIEHIDEPSIKNWKEKLKIPFDRALISLFPGSRKGEIERNLPLILKAFEIFLKNHSQFGALISISDSAFEPIIKKYLEKSDLELGKHCWFVPSEYRYSAIRESQGAIAKSGTITLELALLHCPSVVLYKLSKLNYLLGKYFFKIQLPYYSLPNILLNTTVFPEWFGLHINPENIAHDLSQVIMKKANQQNFHKLNEILTQKKASQMAADEIIKRVVHA